MFRRVVLAFTLVLWAVAAYAQQGNVKSTGVLTPGHAARWMTTGAVIGDAGGAAGSTTNNAGYLTELGITNTGLPSCINDALTNAQGGYHRLCFGANALGGGLISYDAVNGATQLPLQILVNGQAALIPGSISGLPAVANLAALKAITPGTVAVVYREGYSASGDGGQAFYSYSGTSCSLNAGAGDNGFQVEPAAGTGCWTAEITGDPDLRLWGTLGASTDNTIWTAADAAIGSGAWPSNASKTVYLGPVTTSINNLTLTNLAGIRGENKYTSVIAQSQAGTPTTNDNLIGYVGTGPFLVENIQFSGPLYNPANWGTVPTCHDFLRIGPTTSTRAANFTARHLRFIGCTNHVVVFQTEYTDMEDLFSDRGYGFGWVVSDQDDTATVRTQHIRIHDTQGRGMGQYCGSLPAEMAGVMQAPRDIELINIHCDGSGFIAQKQCFDVTGSSADQMKIIGWGINCFNGGLSTKRLDSTASNVPSQFKNQDIKFTYYANIDNGWCLNANYELDGSGARPPSGTDQRGQMYADIYCTFTKPAIYQANWYYDVGDVVKNTSNQNYYMAIAPGITGAASAPTGTGTGITDGTVTWQYLQAAPTNDASLALEGVRLAAITDAEIHLHAQQIGVGYDLVPQGSTDQTIRRAILYMDGVTNAVCLRDAVPSEFGLQNAFVDYVSIHMDCTNNNIGTFSGAIQIGATSGGFSVEWNHSEFVGGIIRELTQGWAVDLGAGRIGNSGFSDNLTFNGTHLIGFDAGIVMRGTQYIRLAGAATIDVTDSASATTPIQSSDGAGAIYSDGYSTIHTAAAVGGGAFASTSNVVGGTTVFSIRAVRGFSAVSPVSTGCSGGDIFFATAPGVGGQPVNGWMCTTPDGASGTWTSF